MTRQKAFLASVGLVCIVLFVFISHKVIFDTSSNDVDYATALKSEAELESSLAPGFATSSKDESTSPNALLVTNSETSYSSTTTPTILSQFDLRKEALEFWEAEYSHMKNMNVSDLISYMSQDDPTAVEIFEYTTPDEKDSLYNNFQKNFKNITSIIEDPDVNLTVEQDDVSDSRPLVFLKYSTASSNLTVALSTTYGFKIDNILGITLNGQGLFLLDEQLWSEISSKSYDRYFKTLDY